MNATLAWEFILCWVFLPPVLAAGMVALRSLVGAARPLPRRRPGRMSNFLPRAASMAASGGQ